MKLQQHSAVSEWVSHLLSCPGVKFISLFGISTWTRSWRTRCRRRHSCRSLSQTASVGTIAGSRLCSWQNICLWILYRLVSSNQDTNQTLVKSLQEQGKFSRTFSIIGIISTGSSFAVKKFVDLSPVEYKTWWIFFGLSGQIKSSLTPKFDKCGPKGLAHYLIILKSRWMNQPVSNSESKEEAIRRSDKAWHCETEGKAAKVKVI